MSSIQKRTLTLCTIFVFTTAIFGWIVTSAQSPDTVFIRQDKNYDDTLIYKTDIVIFQSGMTKHILIGTTVLPWTDNQQMAKGYRLYFHEVKKSDCLQSEEIVYRSPDKINSIIDTDSTLTVDISITDNCCYDFFCDISVDSSATLNLIFYGYGTYCFCYCCFGLTYYFSKLKSPDYPDLKAVMINSNHNTTMRIKK